VKLVLYGALVAVALSLAVSNTSQVEAQPSCQGSSQPTVIAVDPPAARPWSYVIVWGCNLHGQLHTECEVLFGGVRGFVTSGVCSDMMIVAVPIAAQSGPVTVALQGVPTAPFAFNLLTLDIGPEDIYPGIVDVAVVLGADINPIAAQVGGNASDLGLCSSLWCWYRLNVPVGQEVQASISLYSHQDVLYAAPDPVPVPAGSGSPDLAPIENPAQELPSTGAQQINSSVRSVPIMLGAALVLVSGLSALVWWQRWLGC